MKDFVTVQELENIFWKIRREYGEKNTKEGDAFAGFATVIAEALFDESQKEPDQ